jgi:hypothetical protein
LVSQKLCKQKSFKIKKKQSAWCFSSKHSSASLKFVFALKFPELLLTRLFVGTIGRSAIPPCMSCYPAMHEPITFTGIAFGTDWFFTSVAKGKKIP